MFVDIGVFTSDSKGEDSLVYLQKHLINSEASEIRIEVLAEPSKAGIDPLNKLIDRHPDDNSKTVVLKE